MKLDENTWKQKLTPEQYQILREKGTEPPFSGDHILPDKDGEFMCAGCGAKLFSSKTQYESKLPGLQGWPSFADALDDKAIKLQVDTSLGMERTEVVCATCDGHLGHLFDDHTSPNGKHYCINSISLEFRDAKTN